MSRSIHYSKSSESKWSLKRGLNHVEHWNTAMSNGQLHIHKIFVFDYLG